MADERHILRENSKQESWDPCKSRGHTGQNTNDPVFNFYVFDRLVGHFID
jgi:hypothetical protein